MKIWFGESRIYQIIKILKLINKSKNYEKLFKKENV